MKKLSIEEKAKRYDEAIEKLHEIITTDNKPVNPKEIGEYLFTELKESEDERIVKELLTFFRESIHGGHILTNKEYDSWIAWLEKQGEQKKKQYQIYESTKDRFYKEGVEDGILIGIKKQKPAWSEEDERISSNINLYIRKAGDYPHFGKENIKEARNWMNALKDRVQPKPKQEWSGEDEKAINDIMWIIEAYRKNGFNETHIQMADSSENWLKSLKERYTWKPSEYELKVLKLAAEKDGACLMGLYQQLKKLRGE